MSSQGPATLPEFGKPPLNEVVLGVQFAHAKGYQQIQAGEVWSLFKEDYPKVEEHEQIEPVFETFGLPNPGQTGGRLSFITGAIHNRFWFLRDDGDELIQFQPDRLLHNWRKIEGVNNEYPRFEAMSSRFRAELEQLQSYFNSLSPQGLSINQCEVSYINHIDIGDGPVDLSAWLRDISINGIEIDDLNIGFREIIRGDHHRPIGRFQCEVKTGVKPNGQRLIALVLTVRGAPTDPAIENALHFLSKGRELIVSKFAQITTEKAHEIWERRR